MTIDDLLRVYDAASTALYLEWTKDETLDDITNDDIKLAGIRAVVEALLDEAWSRDYGSEFIMMLKEILASDGEVGPTVGEVAEGSLEVGPVQAAGESAERADDKQATVPAAEFCEWKSHWSDGRHFWIGCKNYAMPRYDWSIRCNICKRPIKFEEVTR